MSQSVSRFSATKPSGTISTSPTPSAANRSMISLVYGCSQRPGPNLLWKPGSTRQSPSRFLSPAIAASTWARYGSPRRTMDSGRPWTDGSTTAPAGANPSRSSSAVARPASQSR